MAGRTDLEENINEDHKITVTLPLVNLVSPCLQGHSSDL